MSFFSGDVSKVRGNDQSDYVLFLSVFPRNPTSTLARRGHFSYHLSKEHSVMNPLTFPVIQQRSGFSNVGAPTIGDRFLSHEAYLYGDLESSPGDPSLIDGQLLIPDLAG